MKLLTQLAFLAVLLTASLSIARERQRGVLAMLFSKPVPRWSLVIAKGAAHLSIGVVGLVLGAVLDFAVVWVAYGQPDAVAFAALNGLMLIWFATYVAVGMAASCTARTEGGAIGWVAVFTAILLLLGAIPKFGAIAPGGLTAWAHELASGGAVHPNGGAIALSVVLLVIALIRAIDRLEQAEL